MSWLVGRCPTRSTWRLENLAVGGGRSTSGARVCRWILEDWQGWHSLHHFRISCFMPCQTKRWVMACCVGRAPACESPWIWSNTGRVQDLGKTGWVTPVDVSHAKLMHQTECLEVWVQCLLCDRNPSHQIAPGLEQVDRNCLLRNKYVPLTQSWSWCWNVKRHQPPYWIFQ